MVIFLEHEQNYRLVGDCLAARRALAARNDKYFYDLSYVLSEGKN